MLADIKDILIISTPRDISYFQDLLGNGERFGISLTYDTQPSPDGIAQAFIIGKKFIGNDNVCLILGDNIFCGKNLDNFLSKAIDKKEALFLVVM